MSVKGEISEPVESEHGFHIIKFIERTKTRQLSFDDVKQNLMRQEKERLAKKRHEEALLQVRSTSTVTVHLDKLDALTEPVDEVLAKAAAEAARQASQPK